MEYGNWRSIPSQNGSMREVGRPLTELWRSTLRSTGDGAPSPRSRQVLTLFTFNSASLPLKRALVRKVGGGWISPGFDLRFKKLQG
jgi:hypothetical protein